MDRKESLNRYFVQRIPADVKAGAIGMTLSFPVGDALVLVAISASTKAVPGEAKVRQATIAAHLAGLYREVCKLPRYVSTRSANRG